MPPTTLTLWLTIIGIGAITYVIRLSFIVLLGRLSMPAWLGRALRFVPPAVLSAIILPELVLPGGALNLSLSNPRLIAGTIAAVVAWRTKNVLLTIGAGMAVLWLLQMVAR
jgi:branched-subunit amino acid transport protein